MAQDGSILCQQGLLVRELQMYGSKNNNMRIMALQVLFMRGSRNFCNGSGDGRGGGQV